MAMPGISRGSRRSFRSSVRTIAAYIFRFSASLLSVPAPMKEIDLRAGAGGDPVPASCSGGETFSGCSVFDSAEAQSAPEPSKASEYLTAWFIMIGVFVVRCIVERITETSSASARFPRPGGSWTEPSRARSPWRFVLISLSATAAYSGVPTCTVRTGLSLSGVRRTVFSIHTPF